MRENKITNHLKYQSFQPGIFSLFINPFFFIRSAYYKNIKRFIPRLNGKLLDFGCGRKPFENLFTVEKYVGVDLQNTGHDHKNSKVDVYYDGKHLPFENESFDSLFCGEVLEHIFVPDEILPEINRVLKPGAKALITVPFSWNEHESPYDYARYSSFGIKHLLEKNGFKIIEHKKSGNFARVNFQNWALYFFELFKKWGKAGYILSLVFIIPINIIGSLLLIIMPKNETLYFTNIILAEKSKI
ncbi:MAG TPA: methyltransferase domain-containing protein [Chitinophagaceae bacterium]|nr:methyltransferase domain-containing protein [Chitinophagaceae bacterium]